MKSLWKMLAAAIVVVGANSTASAAIIFNDSGTGDYGFAKAANATTWTIQQGNQLNGGVSQVTRINQNIDPMNPLGTAVNYATTWTTLTFSTTGVVNPMTGETTYAGQGTATKTIYDASTPTGTSNSFTLSGFNAIVTPTGNGSTISISGFEDLNGPSVGINDWSLFDSPPNFPGLFTISIQDTNFNFNTAIASAGAQSRVGTDSFNQTARPRDVTTGGDIPEPTSMALFGLMGIAGGLAARRKLKKAPVA